MFPLSHIFSQLPILGQNFLAISACTCRLYFLTLYCLRSALTGLLFPPIHCNGSCQTTRLMGCFSGFKFSELSEFSITEYSIPQSSSLELTALLPSSFQGPFVFLLFSYLASYSFSVSLVGFLSCLTS